MPPSDAAMPPANADLATTWAYLEEGIDQIMNHLREGVSYAKYQNLYTVAYNYCVSSRTHTNIDAGIDLGGRTGANLMGFVLYNNLVCYFMHHLRSLCDASDPLVDEPLLRYYVQEWDRYTTGASYVTRLFTYLNRHWVKRENDEGRKNVYPVYILALMQWKDNFLRHVQSRNNKLTNAILKLIEMQRNGETIDQTLLKKVVDSFVLLDLDEQDTNKVSLGVYKANIEAPFINATEKRYTAESEAFLQSNTFSNYLKQAEERLREEGDRVERYLNGKTRKICEHVLIRVYSERMWEEFQNLLDYDKHEDLQRTYAILTRIPKGLEPLQKKFEEHVKRAGQAAISRLVGEGGANAELEPKIYVDALLEVYRRNQHTVQRSFKKENGFVAAFDKACRDFVNRNAATGTSTTKSAELLAKHADALLRKKNKFAEKGDLEDALNQVIILFKYIDDKIVFQTFYTVKLSKRLIHSVSASDEAEASMISKLKNACGFEYTKKLQRMSTDISLSKDLTDQFRERTEQSGDGAGADVTFTVMVLGINFWPLNAPTHDFTIPREILPTYERFTQYYQNKHSGRKLTWLWNYSKNELRTNTLNQKYILMTSSYQMAVLIQYNNNDSLTLDELIKATGITKDLLVQVVGVLVKAKVLIEGDTEQFDFNPNFKSKRIRVNLNQPIKAEDKAEAVDVLKAVDEDRKYIIQATIVRIMKARKMLKNQALIEEVISQISQRFTPKIQDIKKAIDTLLEREYIERAEDQRETFNYLA